MTVILKTDSDNCAHEIWAQDQEATCAVASIWMARNQAKQMSIDEGEWSLAWSMFNQVVRRVPLALAPEPAPRSFNSASHKDNQDTMGNMFSKHGTYMKQVVAKLQIDGLKTSLTAFPFVDYSRISETTPAIILLGWYNNGVRNGGHFIVASRVTKAFTIVYLDPWGGQLNEMGPGPGYQSTGRFEQICYLSA